MNDLEELLRSDLHRAVELIDTEPDVAGALTGGRHARRAQVARRTIGGTAGVLAVALLAWAGLAPRVLSGVPEPAQTVSTAPVATSAPPSGGPTYVAEETLTRSLVLDTTDVVELAYVGVQKLTIKLRVDGTAADEVDVIAVAKDGEKLVKYGSVGPETRFLAKLKSNLWVLVTPREVLWAEGAVKGGITPATIEELGGYSIVVVTGEPELALAGFIWQDGSGAAWTDRGERVPSAVLALGDRTFRFVSDESLRVACSGEKKAGIPFSAARCSWLDGDAVQSGGSGSDESGWESQYFIVLPEGATGGSLDPNDNCSSAWAALDPGEREVLLVVCGGSADEPEGGNPVVRYRDADGSERTLAP